MARKKGGAAPPSTRGAGRRGRGATPQSKPRETGVSRGDPRWAGRRARSARGLRSAEARFALTEGTRRDQYGIPEMAGLMARRNGRARAKRLLLLAEERRWEAAKQVEMDLKCERRVAARRETLFATGKAGKGRKPGPKERKRCR